MLRYASMLLLVGCANAQTPPPKGVVLVSMDTVRADHVEPFGAAVGSTPTIAALAKEGVAFENCFSVANETLFSHGAVFTSQIPSHVAPVNYDFTIPDGTPTLASQMQAAGFATGAVVAGGHLSRVFGEDDGFQTFTEGQPWGSFQETIPMALRWVDQQVSQGKPFFLFVHGYDAHSPYAKPGVFARLATPGQHSQFHELLFDPLFYEQVYKDRFYPDFTMERQATASGNFILGLGIYERIVAYSKEVGVPSTQFTQTDLDFIFGSYKSAILYADLWIGVLMAELQRKGLLATTTVAVMSDHGEGLLEHDYFNHRHTLRDNATHVPLVIRPPGGIAATRISAPVSLLDLAPTLLELAGAETAWSMEGTSLKSCFGGTCADRELPYFEGALGEVGVTDGRHRLVVSGKLPEDPALDAAIQSGRGVTFRLYDRQDGEKIDHSGDPALAETLAKLRDALLTARARGR